MQKTNISKTFSFHKAILAALLIFQFSIGSLAQTQNGNEDIQFQNENGTAKTLLEKNNQDYNSVIEGDLPETKITEIGNQLKIEVKDFTYYIENMPSDPALMSEFESLTKVEKESFLKTRTLFLKTVASIFHYSRLGIGIGTVTKNKIKQIVKSVIPKKDGSELPKDSEIRLMVERQIEEQKIIEQQAEEQIKIENAGKSKAEILREHGIKFAYNLLNGIDKILFQQAKLVANSDEFGFTAGIGPTLAAGFGKKTFGGVRDIAINIGFNPKTRTVVFEIQYLAENLKEAYTPVGIIGLDIRTGMYFKNSTKGLEHIGSSFFPPGIPVGTSKYPAYFEAGMASGMAFPPIITDMYGFTNASERTALIRMEFSPLLKGFFRLQIGTIPHSFKVVFFKVVDLASKIRSLAPRTAAPLCRGVFAY